MAGCCDPRGCDRVFGDRFARRRAARYRRKGLDRTARRMVALLAERDVRGRTVLEIGGGVGEIGLELLRRGAASVTNLELSPAYEVAAAALAAEAGLSHRVDRRMVDIAAEPDAVEPADILVAHRVVCCYPDYAGLLGTAADHTRRQVLFSFPPRNPVFRAVTATENAMLRLSGREFRTFAHPPAAMLAVLAERGLHPTLAHRGRVWQIATATR
ncbi:methyltransferase domain-containing protein [Modestobacter marinus]|uniref:methyltransferase domain-containing protein n=1 Tax=Modestobacter marinus TaxID=477641 RepID=UPI001C957C7A|nr:methyltransferase domain-containing protein [Modestobacter marinus]